MDENRYIVMRVYKAFSRSASMMVPKKQIAIVVGREAAVKKANRLRVAHPNDEVSIFKEDRV